MAATGNPLTQRLQLDRFLHATVGTERNGMDLSVLSLLARAEKAPWAEAARLVGLPKAAAVDSMVAAIACLPTGSLPPAHARTVALCLVPLLPGQARFVPHALKDDKRHDGCMRY